MNDKQTIEAEVVPTQAVAVRPQAPGLPTVADLEQSFALAVRQRELLSDYIKKQLKPGKHFYQRGDQKPSLTKEGAEIILLPHGLVPDYEWISGPQEPPEGDRPYQITMKCSLRRKGETDSFCGSGIGSAGSHHRLKDGKYVARQPDRYLCHNATVKMAQKSSMIAATINSTAASEFFTQDMDSESSTNGTPVAAPSRPVAASKPSSATTAPPKASVPAKPKQAKMPTAATRLWMMNNLKANPGGAGRNIVTEYFQKVGQLLPTEQIEDLPLRFVPFSKQELEALMNCIGNFEDGGDAVRAFEPHGEAEDVPPPSPNQDLGKALKDVPRGTIEVPRDENIDCNNPDAPWRSFPVPFGKHAGTKLADLDKKVLFGFWANYQPEETWTDKNGNERQTKPEKLAKDRKFRAMLDEAGNHYEFEKPEGEE